MCACVLENSELAYSAVIITDYRFVNWANNVQKRTSHKACAFVCVKKGSPYLITERRVPELIPVLGSQPAGDASHKPSGRLPLLSARPAVTPATVKRAATSFAAW